MTKTHIVAVNRERTHLVLKRGHHYALIKRAHGITRHTKWGGHKVLSSLATKNGSYRKLKKPRVYKGHDHARKSLEIDLEKGKAIKRVDKQTERKSKLDNLADQMSLQNFKQDLIVQQPVRKSDELVIDLVKAGKKHLPDGAERFAYKVPSDYGVIYIPVNRLRQVYQTDGALNPKKIAENREKMRAGIPLEPVEIGYNYDVHDGHHRWHGAMGEGHTHVPCKVKGTDPEKLAEAKKKYREIWKSTYAEAMMCRDVAIAKSFIDSSDTEAYAKEVKKTSEKNLKDFLRKLGIRKSMPLVIDISKGRINTAKLVKRAVQVRGKGGQVFTRMQWVDPHDEQAMKNSKAAPEGNHSTFAHHEKEVKEIEKRQSNKFPVRHHKVSELKNTNHNYRVDKEKLKQAEEDFKAGRHMAPVKINHKGEIIDNHHLVDLAKKHKLSHVPVMVFGNPTMKKELEDKLKEKVTYHDKETGEKEVLGKNNGHFSPYAYSRNTEFATQLQEFESMVKRFPREHVMKEAVRQGIGWKTDTDAGKEAPQPIQWMRAMSAIKKHITTGGTFELKEDRKLMKQRANELGKTNVDIAFDDLLNKKHNGDRQSLMDWADGNGIVWKHKSDPSINWMYAATAIKKELAKGRMLDGVRTRNKGLMDEANLVISDSVKAMVKNIGKNHDRPAIMERMQELGIEYENTNKKGEALPQNSPILWMRASTALQKYIAKGNQFAMKGEDPNADGITATLGNYGDGKVSKAGQFALDTAKANSKNFEKQSSKWAKRAFMVDFGVDEAKAEEMYKDFMDKARNTKVMVHFDPLEQLKGGTSMIDQMISDGIMKNDFDLDRGFDQEHKESIESDLFGPDYEPKTDSERAVYGVADLFNHGVNSSPYGDAAITLKDDARKRTTATYTDSNNIPYGQEGKAVYSMEDPHHLLVQRWHSRWKTPNKPDAQRKRAIESVINGTPYKDDKKYFESHVHGGIDFAKDVENITIPHEWKNKEHADKHSKITEFANLHNIPIKYE
jgi:hypothetical protein